MSDPLIFQSSTARHALPLLFAGQSQKEATVNGALGLADILLHPAIEGEASSPPESPGDGESWLVGASPSGAFAGREGSLACYQLGAWIFAAPRDGMRVLDRSTGQFLHRHGEWRRETTPEFPTGGEVVDQQSRATIVAILHLLERTGILPGQ